MIFEAIKFVAVAHEGQYRKGTNVPYIWHLMSVMKILCEYVCEEVVIVAGILHDVVEDTPTSIDEVEITFGKKVADIVRGASEKSKVDGEKLDWTSRKKEFLTYVEKEATLDGLLVICADKLDAMRSIKQDLASVGKVFWDRFNANKASQKWYYMAISSVLVIKGLLFGGALESMTKALAQETHDVFDLS